MVLRVFANRGCWESSDEGGGFEENASSENGGGFSITNSNSISRSGGSNSNYYSSSLDFHSYGSGSSSDRRERLPPPPIFGRPVIVFQPEQQPNRLDYSLRKEQVDRIRWPGELHRAPKRSDPKALSRRLIADILHGRYSPRRPRKGTSSSSSAAAPQDIHQRGLSAEDFPIYNSENTAHWRSPISSAVYPDVLEERTWISYGTQRKQPRRKLRNYY